MDVQFSVGTLVRAITTGEVSQLVEQLAEDFKRSVTAVIDQFLGCDLSPAGTHRLEVELLHCLRGMGREIVQWLLANLEPELEKMPGTLKHQGKTHRRLAVKSMRTDIVTCFGKVSLLRGRYRRGRAGRTIFPLELLLGLENGFTPAAGDRVGKQFAQAGSSQGRTLSMIADQLGAKIGTEKLRKLIATLTNGLEPLRQEAQVEKLLQLVADAREKQAKPVLSVSRDGVALGLAPWSFFEMASVATVSVLANGKRLGTVYLGRTPETNQKVLSAQLTALLRETIRRCGDQVPEMVYVTDAGKIETAYWKNTLRKLFVNGRRIKITRVVDYYHASERLTKIADALKLGHEKWKRQDWLKHVRKLLLEPGGHGRVLRSIARMRELYGYKSSGRGEAEKAEKYLRRYKRFMDYAGMKEQNYPIGSGVVESACKQVVSERMKLAGMRWHREGGQQTMTLRCLLLSGIWDTVYKKWLDSKPTVKDLINLEIA